LLKDDPEYLLVPVYEYGGVAILEVRPNRLGRVHDIPELWEQRLAYDPQRAARAQPHRWDLRQALVLHYLGHKQQLRAVVELDQMIDGGLRTVKTLFLRGSAHLASEDYPAAWADLTAAAQMPNRKYYLSMLNERLRQTRAGLQGQLKSSGTLTQAEQSSRLQRLIQDAHFSSARQLAQTILKSRPDAAEVLAMQGVIHEALGEIDSARAVWTQAASLGSEAAAEFVRYDQLEQRLQAGDAELEPGSILELSRHLEQRDRRGRALAVLERAAKMHTDELSILIELARFQLRFGMVDAAQVTYDTCRSVDSADPRVSELGADLDWRLQSPRFD